MATVQVAQGGRERRRGRAAGLATGLRVQRTSLFPSLPFLQCLDLDCPLEWIWLATLLLLQAAHGS